MRVALQWMGDAAARGNDPHGVIANTMAEPYLDGGQVWMSIATGRALERRGLIRVDECFQSDAYLVAAGGEPNG
jgi:hypothetical protein